MQVAIPCRPAKIFTVYVLDVPEELPEDDIRHALYKYRSIVEVTRLPLNTGTVCESRKCKYIFFIFFIPSFTVIYFFHQKRKREAFQPPLPPHRPPKYTWRNASNRPLFSHSRFPSILCDFSKCPFTRKRVPCARHFSEKCLDLITRSTSGIERFQQLLFLSLCILTQRQ